MKKAIKFLTVVATLIFMSSFVDNNATNFVGIYGVSASDPSQIKLTINSDHTFYYQDFSIASKKINVKGKWVLKNKKVILNDENFNRKFHNVWTFVENGHVAKSRRGLSFYRLIKI